MNTENQLLAGDQYVILCAGKFKKVWRGIFQIVTSQVSLTLNKSINKFKNVLLFCSNLINLEFF